MADNSRKGEIEKLLNLVIENGATDLHISSGKPPMIRQDGSLKSLEGWETLDKEGAKDVALSLLSDDQEKKFWENKDVDFSFAFEDKARFRVSVYQETGNVAAALRFIPNKVRTIEELNLPPLLHNFSQASQGFFLVVGPSGHGKSAALAAIIDDINKTRQDHILTIEDPIEYQFEQEKCIIDQREVGVDCLNFQSGLRAMFREDVDICMIGEMRDPETIATAMTAAETGHLILSTLHTNTASQTIDRIIDSFPPHQQAQVRSQMASTLLGVISRRLVPCKDGGVINAIELMIANRNLIREGKVHQIDMVIDTSSEEGMISLNRSLADLVKRGIVDQEKAINFSPNPNEFNMLTQ